MAFINNNFLWEFYPGIQWKILFVYLLGLFGLREKQWEFTFFFILVLMTILMFYRKPTVIPRVTHTTQVCNIDYTCRTLVSDAYSNPNEILAPAFGYVSNIKQDGVHITITIILNIFSIHAQYAPIGGRVITKEYFPGKFHLAGLVEKSDLNEHQLIEIAAQRGVVGVKQIAGVLTRRITTPVEVNDTVGKGEYIGFIHLGSRVDLIIPSENIRVLAKVGDHVEGFNTKMALWLI